MKRFNLIFFSRKQYKRKRLRFSLFELYLYDNKNEEENEKITTSPTVVDKKPYIQ